MNSTTGQCELHELADQLDGALTEALNLPAGGDVAAVIDHVADRLRHYAPTDTAQPRPRPRIPRASGPRTIQVTDHMLTGDQVYVMVRDRFGKREITDAAARTIASWWQSPRNTGFTRLASGLHVTQEEIAADIVKEYPKTVGIRDRTCLDMLGTWALAKLRYPPYLARDRVTRKDAETKQVLTGTVEAVNGEVMYVRWDDEPGLATLRLDHPDIRLLDTSPTAEDTLRCALEDLARNGLRCDLMPTMLGVTTEGVVAAYNAYLARIDENVRERAHASLAEAQLRAERDLALGAPAEPVEPGQRRRVVLRVGVDLDPAPGQADSAESWERTLRAHLRQIAGHYNPTVERIEAPDA